MDISIIVPAYNAEKYIEECLQSCIFSAKQAGLSFEIIVVDDGSTDHTARIAKIFCTACISQVQQGTAVARNAGLAQAQGQYIFFQDADDLISKEALSYLHTSLVQHPEGHLACALAKDFISPELAPEQKKLFLERPHAYGGTLPGTTLIRRSVFEHVGYFDTQLKTGETVDWLLRVQDAGMIKIPLEEVTLLRRLHPTSTSALHKTQERKDYLAILRKKHAKK